MHYRLEMTPGANTSSEIETDEDFAACAEDTLTTSQKLINLSSVFVPLIALVFAVVLLWGSGIGWRDIAIMALFYMPTAIGITVGFHRLLTHKSFECKRWVRCSLTVMGCFALEGDEITWVADHRKHHRHSDAEGDPHSPHLHEEAGWRGLVKGLIHAHCGWLLEKGNRATDVEKEKYCKDLLEDPFMVWTARRYWGFVVATLLLPGIIGYLWAGTLGGFLGGIFWGGLVRVALLHHVTYSINSICHFAGKRRFKTNDHSRNVAWLSIASLGESNHHNHHAFPTSAHHGLKRSELDPSALFIDGLEKLGLAWNVRIPSAEAQATRLAEKPS